MLFTCVVMFRIPYAGGSLKEIMAKEEEIERRNRQVRYYTKSISTSSLCLIIILYFKISFKGKSAQYCFNFP